MDHLNRADAKFQCKVHELRNDNDWVNFKRSMVRAPQIVRQALNAGSQMEKDQIFDAFWGKFESMHNEIQDLQSHVIEYNNHIRNYLQHIRNLGDTFKKMFDPKMTSKLGVDDTTKQVFFRKKIDNMVDDINDGIIEDYLQKGVDYERFALATKFTAKVDEITLLVTPNADCIMGNVKEPINNMILIFDQVKLNQTERGYVILDVNKYQDNLTSLQKKQRETTLTLRQEQNLVRYEKDLELAQFRFDQINDQFKRELPRVFELFQNFVERILKVFFFLQLTINYHLLSLNEIQDPLFKLSSKTASLPSRQFLTQLVENYHKSHNSVLESVLNLTIVKSQAEIKLLQMKLEAMNVKDSQDVPSGHHEEISGAGSIRSEIKTCTAEFDYTAEQDGDLSFKKGDKIKILDRKFNENWWKGQVDGEVGIFPKNYVILE